MLDKDTVIRVKNRTDRTVGYKVPDLNIRRQFRPNEPKEVTMGELRSLSYTGGGEYIIRNYFQLDNKEAVRELLGEVEPEYFYTKDQVIELLTNGSLDELKDCLDFAPSGVIDLIKDVAIKTELNDVKKREAIFELTGLNINKAIEFERETKEADKDTEKTRRVKKEAEEEVETSADAPKARRTSLPKYKVTEIKED